MALSYDPELLTSNESAQGWFDDDEPYTPTAEDYEQLNESRLFAEIETASRETKIKAWEMLSAYIERLQQNPT